MTNVNLLQDRIDILALPGEFADAGMMRDHERFASLFTDDGIWEMPHIDVKFEGRQQIRDGIERLAGAWEFLVQNVHLGSISIDGDTAIGRSYISEVGRFRDGGQHTNYSVYHDRFRRTREGWMFTKRTYEVTFQDASPSPVGHHSHLSESRAADTT